MAGRSAVRPRVKRKRSRLSKAARFEQLLDVAFALASEHGPERLTMEAVAAEADVDKALVYRHFPNREAVLSIPRGRGVRRTGRSGGRVGEQPRRGDPGDRGALARRSGSGRNRVSDPKHGSSARGSRGAARRAARGERTLHRREDPSPSSDAGAARADRGGRPTRSARPIVVETFVSMALGAVERLAADRP
jgi:hypothetical protein